MSWKSTLLVSGVGLLATWLARSPAPSAGPSAGRSVPPAATTQALDIQRQAALLQERVRDTRPFQLPSRNVFQFEERLVSSPADTVGPIRPIDTAPAVSQPAISLSGVASDIVDGREERTAILTTPAGVVLAREGDVIDGGLRIEQIAEDAVAIRRLGDEATFTVRFAR